MTMSPRSRTVLPRHGDGSDELLRVADALEAGVGGAVEVGESAVTLPPELAAVLATAIRTFARGDAVTVSPRATLLTTQEAAEVLGVSRPTLVKLLESGRIPFTQPGRHRRVALREVLAFQDAQAKARSSALDELANAPDPDPDGSYGFVQTR
jgi:excisionase family DNA binding protein